MKNPFIDSEPHAERAIAAFEGLKWLINLSYRVEATPERVHGNGQCIALSGGGWISIGMFQSKNRTWEVNGVP